MTSLKNSKDGNKTYEGKKEEAGREAPRIMTAPIPIPTATACLRFGECLVAYGVWILRLNRFSMVLFCMGFRAWGLP
jgi:hypothetical protein